MTKTEMETAFLFRLREMVSSDMLYLGEVWLGGVVSGQGGSGGQFDKVSLTKYIAIV